MTERRTVHMTWQISWQSREASHLEEFFVPLSLYRDADLLPEPLKGALDGWEVGRQVTLTIRPGEILPAYDPERVFTFARQEFQGGIILPRFGRYYPRGLLAGFYGNPLPFRCIGVTAQELQADFNHPFCTYGFTLTATITGEGKESGGTGGQCLDWFDLATSGPGMQARWQGQPTDFFRDNPFGRRDISADARFYEEPRLVSHVDAKAQELLQALYARLLTPEMEILDLMSSWQSHLPADLRPKALIGLGLNEQELQANPQLTGYVLHDLNQNPRLPFEAENFDAVICNLSVEYLIKPFEVFADCARVLKPGGLLVHTFSHRWFPPKVIKLWTELTEFERVGLVLEYFLKDGLFRELNTFSTRNWPRPKEDRYFPQARQADPIYAVWGEEGRVKEPEKIILIRRDNIGDLVCTTPAVAALRQAFPRARLALLANTYNAVILQGHPDLDVLYTVQKPKHAPERARAAVLWENFRVFRQIRRERFDVAVACGSYSPTLAHHTFMTGARMRLGYVRRPPGLPWYTQPVAEPPEPCHEVEKIFRLLLPLGVTGHPGPLRLFPEPQELARFRAQAAVHPATAGKPLLAVAISARTPNKCWPLVRFAELIEALLAEGRLGVVLLWAPGSAHNPLFPGDDEAAASLKARFGARLLPYPTPGLPALVAALFGVDLVVTPDTGSLHIAAAAQKPTVALMPPENVPGWHPWQTPARVLTDPAGVAAIPTPAVLAAVRELAAAHLGG